MTHANYGRRIGAFLVDILFAIVPATVLLVFGLTLLIGTDNVGLGVMMLLLGGGWVLVGGIWNKIFREGRTGQSIGKSMCSIALVDSTSGQPIGPGKAFVRELLTSVLSAVTGGIFPIVDYLFPLWDSQHQRIIDKMVGTVVVSRG
jgi:uncharacterized RDD family membrane protein YckC